ncbi:DUF1027 domain-containing protein [Cohnella sp. CFH 77786]|nr:DUF1027 domain-containing protein [Cohnella sp. CFH 77786]
MFLAGGNAYSLAYEHKNGWNAEAFKERYSEVLERYDYIVGDWGYNQLRLRGFYKDGHPRATKESAISSLVDYLNEYCNFGCAYFVLNKTDASAVPPGTRDLIGPAEPAPKAAGTAGEPDAQTAETAASSANHNGILMRWPLKERPGGPVRVPGAAAMARAAAEAERRQQQANAKLAEGRPSPSGRPVSDGGGYAGRPPGRPSSGGASDRRPGGPNAGQADGRSGGKQTGRGGPRPQGAERQGGGAKPGGSWRQPNEAPRPAEPRAAEFGGQKADAAKNGSRWPGKNRRRNRFGGKPNRPEGAAPGSGTPAHPGSGD